jgi:hypothetical protein
MYGNENNARANLYIAIYTKSYESLDDLERAKKSAEAAVKNFDRFFKNANFEMNASIRKNDTAKFNFSI